MNISVNVDCTPEEARRAMGLPDLSSVHEAYLSKMRDLIERGITPETMAATMQGWGPMTEAGVTLWRQMIENVSGGRG